MSSCFLMIEIKLPFDKDAADDVSLQGVQGWRGLGVSRPEPTSASLPPGDATSPLTCVLQNLSVFILSLIFSFCSSAFLHCAFSPQLYINPYQFTLIKSCHFVMLFCAFIRAINVS